MKGCPLDTDGDGNCPVHPNGCPPGKTKLPDIPAGVYRHYKGPLYQVLGYGHDANDDERITVVYIGIQLQGAHTGPRLATRTAYSDSRDVDAFFDWVHIATGSKCHELPECCPDMADQPSNRVIEHCRRERVRRFTYLGPGFDGWGRI